MDIQSAWKSTCKILLGAEIGELERYGNYLQKYIEPVFLKKSRLSGKPVAISSPHISKNALFISNDEQVRYNSEVIAKTTLDINQIKDMDSIIEAIGESLYYSGNIVLGNSGNTAEVGKCINTNHAYQCNDVYDSKYVAYCSSLRYGECAFGCSIGGGAAYSIHAYEVFKLVRNFETLRTYESHDCHYTANLEGCTNCMYCFNLRNKSHCIGNLQLEKGKFAQLKAKLLEDIRATLVKKKEVPTIVGIIGDGNA